ncbi:MAG: PRC-barrel domain-containing protein [Alphaproteobacteria bacterium]
MLWRTSDVLGRSVRASDGDVGSVADLLFDDETWTIRWVVVDTGGWLPGRKVLVATSAFEQPLAAERNLAVDVTRQRIEEGPSIDAAAPVSRQMERDVTSFFGWWPYWEGAYPPSAIGVPFTPAAGMAPAPLRDGPRQREADRPQGDPHLRSTSEVVGYYIHASDGDIGHVEDFVGDDDGWAIRYMMVDTRNWWPGRKVIVSPRWITSVSWGERMVYVDLTRDQIKASPEYDHGVGIERGYEDRLFGHYGRQGYWT